MESDPSRGSFGPGTVACGVAVCAAVWLWPVLPAQAQDAHYWSNQYGTRSVLLGGAVIGSVTDLSANYYNPGALGLAEDPELVLAAKVYQYTSVTLSGSGDVGVELKSPKFDEAPGFLAGLLPFGFLGKSRLGYTFFTRHSSNIEAEDFTQVSGRESGKLDPGDLFLEQIGFQEKLSENWYGLTWATKFGEAVGLGVSPFLSFRSQDLRLQSISQVLAEGDTSAISVFDNDLSYDVTSLIMKIGVQYKLKKLSTGATITTPGLRLRGSGELKTYRTKVDQGIGDGKQKTLLAAGQSKNESVTYHSPLSIGAGMGYDFGNRSVYFSAEWFDRVSQYNVFETKVVTPQVGVDSVTIDITAQLNPVLNFGVGYSENLGKHFVVYGSFTTDYSAVDPQTENDIALADWNIYHLFTGAEFTFRGADFHLGLGYSFGTQENTKAALFGDDQLPAELVIEIPDRGVDYRAITGMIGIAFTIR